MPKLFISYVREDTEEAGRLATQLESHGVDVWIDRNRLKPGERWADAVRRGISDGDFFLACFSHNLESRARSYMHEEVTLAIDELRQRPIDQAWFIPVRLSDCEIPDRNIGGGETLRSLHWVDLFADWDDGIRRILSVVRPQRKPLVIEPEYVAMFGHQLMSPLYGIRARAETLRTPGLSEEKRQQVSEDLDTLSVLTLHQVRGFVSLMSVMQEDFGLFRAAVDLEREIREAVQLMSRVARDRNVEIDFRPLGSVPRIEADPALIGHLLYLLLDNAVRYSWSAKAARGAPVVVELAFKSSSAVVRVTNKGIGIRADEADRIFLRGYRGSEAKLVTAKGSGLGLYLAKRIVDAHGGHLSFQSDAQASITTFAVVLPVAPPK